MSALKLGPVRQVGYVVKDIEKGIQEWLNLGVGPWFYAEKVSVQDFQYMGKSSDMQMSVALSNSGYMQIELIQQRDETPSLYRDFLQTCGEGIHHVSHWVEDFDEKSKTLFDLGYTIGHSGNIGRKNGRFAYFLNEKLPGTIIEISEMSGFKEKYFKSIAETCLDWDGSDPIRR
ncbi:MAG: VOC family protein [Deltaproteobacteria bacterium]|nr:VOC family protein [Deltaproteobacteria bacterium]